MKITFFTDRPHSKENTLLFKEAKSRGHNAVIKFPWDFTFPKSIDYTDVLYVISSLLYRGTSYEFIHRFNILKKFKQNKSIIFNPLESLLNYSKEFFSIKAKDSDIPHPETKITENIDEAYDFIMNLHHDGKSTVLKPVAAGGGKGVVHLIKQNDIKYVRQYLSYYLRSYGKGVLYLEEYIENSGYDIRLFVINGRIIARMKRSNIENFRYNASLGGIVENFKSTKFDKIALKATKMMSLIISGVDIMLSNDGKPYVLEVNAHPGFKHINYATGKMLEKEIIDCFEKFI